MKILMVTSSYPLFEGDGTAPFIEEIAHAVVARGHQVDIVLPAHPRLRPLEKDHIRFFPFAYAPSPSLNIWGYAQSLKADRGFKGKTLFVAPFAALATWRAVRTRLRLQAYDIVHAHWVVPGGVLACGPAKTAHRPFVISLHGSDVFAAERSRFVGAAARRAFRAAGAVTACSNDLRDRALRLGALADRTRTVPYGVDAEFFRRLDGSSAINSRMRQRLGVGPDQTLVVAVGRLVEKKGFAHLVAAAGGDARLHIALVGDGDLHDDLFEQSRENGASVTLAGRFSRTEIRDALHSADIVAVPSVIDSRGNVDGLPNALLEAMAAGSAIVASRVAGIPDVITDGTDGLLVPPADPGALLRALRELAADSEKRRTLARSAEARAHRDLTWSRVGESLEGCYVQAQTLAKR